MLRHLKVLASLAAMAVAFVSACTSAPKVGDKCKTGEAACLDAKNELQCQGSAFVVAPCKGVRGCTVTGVKQDCDVSGNAPGDVCSTDDEGVAQCLADKKARIVCHAGKYTVERCRGPKGCQESDTRVECDGTLVDEGDECGATDVGYTCSSDKKKALTCVAGKYAVVQNCRGEKGCVVAKQLSCDRGDQAEGDPCPEDNDRECASDKKTLLTCEGKKWAKKETCKRACVANQRNVDCDRRTPEPGDPCTRYTDSVCDADKKIVLTCDEKKEWAVKAECKGACVVVPFGLPKCSP